MNISPPCNVVPGDSEPVGDPPSTSPDECQMLGALMERGGWTEHELVRWRLRDPEGVARLCLDHCLRHPRAVQLLLIRPELARHAVALLGSHATTHPEAVEKLALLLVDAGHVIDERTEALLPPQARAHLKHRREASALYWDEKREKHHGERKYLGVLDGETRHLPRFIARGLPFFSMDPRKSAVNLNGKLGDEPRVYWCRHLVSALHGAEHPKEFLRSISAGRVQDLDWHGLEHACEKSGYEGETSIQFSRHNLGRLLVDIGMLRSMARHSYEIDYLFDGHHTVGHSMLITVERTLGENSLDVMRGEGMKVSFYEPNITGDMAHLRVLPEELTGLSMDDFDVAGTCSGSEVLSMDLKERELPRMLGGRYIDASTSSWRASMAMALSKGNLLEFDAACRHLAERGVPLDDSTRAWTDEQITALSRGLHYAIGDGHSRVIRAFHGFFIAQQFSSKQRLAILMAEFSGFTLECQEADVMEAFAKMVIDIQLHPDTRLLEEDAAVLLDRIRSGIFKAQAGHHAHEWLKKAKNYLKSGTDTTALDNPYLTSERRLAMLMAEIGARDGGLAAAIDRGDKVSVRVFAQKVTDLQRHPHTRLSSEHAAQLLAGMRHAHGSRPFYAFGFLVNSRAYKVHVKNDPVLHGLFKQAKRHLSPAFYKEQARVSSIVRQTGP